jgi:hypothetical protein
LKEIEREAFYSSGLKSIQIPNSVEKLEYECFSQCESHSEVIFESGSKLKEIGERVFNDCPLQCVKIEEGFDAKYNWPKNCRTEYIRHSNGNKRKRRN